MLLVLTWDTIPWHDPVWCTGAGGCTDYVEAAATDSLYKSGHW
jgi:hypothetical protein